VRSRTRAVASACLLAAAATTALAGCASSQSANAITNSREAYEAMKELGSACPDPVISQPTGLDYTQVACPGLRIEWADDTEAYDALWRADCAAVPAEARASMDAIVVVRGPHWLLRGNGDADVDAWPDDQTATEAADRFGGERLSAGDLCRLLGAWPAGS
jgi:hypothetical protein